MIDIYKNISKKYKGRDVIWIDFDKLTPRRIQPFNHSLATDIIKKGLFLPLVLLSNDVGNVQIGNQRYTILKKLKVKKVPVIFRKTSERKKYVFEMGFEKYKIYKKSMKNKSVECFR